MKKWLSAILCIVTVLMCVLVFASCAAKPELDLEDAAENLEDEDYRVEYSDNEDGYLPVYMEEMLYASKGEDADDIIVMAVCKDEKSAKLLLKQVKEQNEELIKYYEARIKMLENKLDLYEDDLDKDEIKDIEERIEDYEETIEKYKEYVYGRSAQYRRRIRICCLRSTFRGLPRSRYESRYKRRIRQKRKDHLVWHQGCYRG